MKGIPGALRAATIVACFGVLTLVAGCTSLRLGPADAARYQKLGLMVIAAAQSLGDKDERQRKLVQDRATTTATALLQERGFTVESLNATLPQQHVFDKIPGAFHINEYVIAEHAKERRLPATLLLLYYYTGEAKPEGLDVTMYYSCAFYAWVLDSETAKGRAAARSNHLFEPLTPLKLSKEQASAIHGQYDEFLRSMTTEMLKDFRLR